MRKKHAASGGADGTEARFSRASVGRLSLYLRRLESVSQTERETVSSLELAKDIGVTDAQVRKDLAALGSLGQPGVGNLARALLRFRGFQQRGFRIVALFDSDAGKTDQVVEGLKIYSMSDIPRVIRASGAELGLLTVPPEAAQTVADQLVAAGIRGVLNFAPTVLHLPPHVSLVSVDLTVQLEQLAFLVQLGAPHDAK
jgi:redox-sensing transcriptional repressor